jgi:hypothetical protein
MGAIELPIATWRSLKQGLVSVFVRNENLIDCGGIGNGKVRRIRSFGKLSSFSGIRVS